MGWKKKLRQRTNKKGGNGKNREEKKKGKREYSVFLSHECALKMQISSIFLSLNQGMKKMSSGLGLGREKKCG